MIGLVNKIKSRYNPEHDLPQYPQPAVTYIEMDLLTLIIDLRERVAELEIEMENLTEQESEAANE